MSEGLSSPGCEERAAARRGWWLLGILCLATLAYWSVQYHPFVLPNNDYHSFERAAQSLGSGELPAKFKRGPVLPAFMALMAPALPAAREHPELHAALLLNMAFSIGVLVLLYRLALPLLGAGALLVPVLFASSEQFHAMALQPLVEPSLGFFCVLTVVLFQARSPWQYAAAAAAALSRLEAATLIPLLFVLNLRWTDERRFWKHAALAALASVPFLAWAALGAMRGSGAGSYLELMRGMGWSSAPGFLVSCYREPFAGWFLAGSDLGSSVLFKALIVLLALVPTAVGVLAGLRDFRREASLMLGFLGLSAAVIVLFGIDKSRYVYPTEWIVLFFFAAGALRWLEAGYRLVAPRIKPRAELPVMLLVLLVLAAALGQWGKIVVKFTHGAPAPVAIDLLYAALALVLVLAATVLLGVRLRQESSGRLWWAACCLFVALITPVVVGGIAAKERGLFTIQYANYSSYVLAGWLEENLGPRDRVVLLHPTHVRYLTDLGAERLEKFSKMRAGSAAELATEMREKGLTHVAYTYRRPARNPAAELYDRKKKTALALAFQGGGEIAGFERVATLDLPEGLGRSPVQIYRVTP